MLLLHVEFNFSSFHIYPYTLKILQFNPSTFTYYILTLHITKILIHHMHLHQFKLHNYHFHIGSTKPHTHLRSSKQPSQAMIFKFPNQYKTWPDFACNQTHSFQNVCSGKPPFVGLMQAWISSNVFPFVSGTTLATNNTVNSEIAEYTKNVPARCFVPLYQYQN